MDAVRLAVRLGVAVVAAVALVALSVTLPLGSPPTRVQLTDEAGGPFIVPSTPGAYAARFQGEPVVVLVQPGSILAGVEATRGEGSATPSVPHPQDPRLRVLALSARSTMHGCVVAWQADLGASLDVEDYDGDGRRDGRLLDPCHLGSWDAFHRGGPVAGPSGLSRLAALHLHVRDGALHATGFDGPVGPQARLKG